MQGFGDVEIDDFDVSYAKELGGYSNGDDDVIIFALAFEYALNQVRDSNVMFDPDSSLGKINSIIIETAKSGFSSISGGSFSELTYLLLGREAQDIFDYSDIQKELEKLKKKSDPKKDRMYKKLSKLVNREKGGEGGE